MYEYHSFNSLVFSSYFFNKSWSREAFYQNEKLRTLKIVFKVSNFFKVHVRWHKAQIIRL